MAGSIKLHRGNGGVGLLVEVRLPLAPSASLDRGTIMLHEEHHVCI
jgi:hypothetical protein